MNNIPKTFALVFIGLTGLLCLGCGNKGPLVRPEANAASQPQSQAFAPLLSSERPSDQTAQKDFALPNNS